MILGKDQYKVKCMKGALIQAKNRFETLAVDLQFVMDAYKSGKEIDINTAFYKLADHIGRCKAMAEICELELH